MERKNADSPLILALPEGQAEVACYSLDARQYLPRCVISTLLLLCFGVLFLLSGVGIYPQRLLEVPSTMIVDGRKGNNRHVNGI